MTIFIENIWVWFGLAFLVLAIGYITFLNDRKVRTLGITLGVTALVLAIGFALFFFVETDRKSITRMLTDLARSIEQDDLDGVLRHIQPGATGTQVLARSQMALVRVSSARFKDLKVVVNDMTSPPEAKITFTAVVYWQTKGAAAEFFATERPLLEMVKFDVELVKSRDNSWLVTDHCLFTPRAGP